MTNKKQTYSNIKCQELRTLSFWCWPNHGKIIWRKLSSARGAEALEFSPSVELTMHSALQARGTGSGGGGGPSATTRRLLRKPPGGSAERVGLWESVARAQAKVWSIAARWGCLMFEKDPKHLLSSKYLTDALVRSIITTKVLGWQNSSYLFIFDFLNQRTRYFLTQLLVLCTDEATRTVSCWSMSWKCSNFCVFAFLLQLLKIFCNLSHVYMFLV